ncbi:MAG TPA: Hsp20/alpha crystallin family protein [Pyrinomonadaceae bacterium]|jgi:HSP20 family protein
MIKPARVTGLERIELERLRDRVGLLFSALQEATITDDAATPGAWSPPVDVCETKNEVTIRVEVPGVRAEHLMIGMTTTQLRICGQKKKRVPRNRVISHLCSERTYGHFSRIVPLRWTINVRAATAELSNGVLVVRLPKQKDRRGAEFKVMVKENDE